MSLSIISLFCAAAKAAARCIAVNFNETDNTIFRQMQQGWSKERELEFCNALRYYVLQTLTKVGNMVSMSMRLPEDVANRLDALAGATGRTKSFLAVQAIKDFLEREAWQVAEINKALAEADAGDFATAEEMNATDAKWGYSAR